MDTGLDNIRPDPDSRQTIRMGRTCIRRDIRDMAIRQTPIRDIPADSPETRPVPVPRELTRPRPSTARRQRRRRQLRRHRPRGFNKCREHRDTRRWDIPWPDLPFRMGHRTIRDIRDSIALRVPFRTVPLACRTTWHITNNNSNNNTHLAHSRRDTRDREASFPRSSRPI